LDGVLQIWAGYELPPVDARIVTFGDLTVPQALELGYPEVRALSKRDVERRMDLQRRCFERAFACCTTTRWAARSIVDDYGIDPRKVHAIGLGRNHTVSVVDRHWSTPRFLFIGTNWFAKNGDAVLSAFLRLRSRIPAAELHLVGTHPSVEADGVTGHGVLRLDHPSERRRLEQLFAVSTCFVLPSRYEASAIAYLEAGAAGLPCIGTSVGGSSEFIGDAGLLVDPADEAGLFAAMVDLADPATAARLGQLALRRAPLFTWRAVAERLLRAFELPSVPVTGFADFL
jgi:glycosyltransferase involved in cell wall biosynthesis